MKLAVGEREQGHGVKEDLDKAQGRTPAPDVSIRQRYGRIAT